MFLLSKFFPKLAKHKEDDKTPCLGDKSKDYVCRILLLDDEEFTVNIKSSARGQAVLNKVFERLNLIEREYFGVRYLDATNQTHWLDPLKTVTSQLKHGQQHTLYFGVKFYAADPCKLHEEITRYQFFKQIQRDILQGRLPVSFDTAAELGAYIVQSELGDYDPKRLSSGYVSEFRLVPNQSEDMETRISQLHKQLGKMVPAVAEYKFLDKVKWLEMYGVDLHPVQGEGSIEFFVGLTPTGIVVYRNKSKHGNYFWPRITKVTFKGKMFMIRVKDKNNYENTYAFECSTKQACKHLWKCCIEHHSFFRSAPLRIENYTKRLTQAQNSVNGPGKIFSFGSKHRYSGRTERQALGDSMNRQPPSVVRTPSKRQHRRNSIENIGPGHQSMPSLPQTDGPITTVVTPEPVKTPSEQRKAFAAPDSPRSTKSAPWEGGHHRKGGLYTSGRDSPMSTRSEKMMFPKHSRGAQSGSESESGTHRHRRRGDSDSESEVSAKRHRRKRERGGAASEGELEQAREPTRPPGRHSRRSADNLTTTEYKWNDIQRRIRDGTYGTPYDAAMGTRPNGSLNSMPGSETSQQRRRRRRSRSPGNKRPPEELAQHFKYIEPEPGMTDEQLRDIPYTQVETAVEPPRMRHSPRTRQRAERSARRKSYGEGSHVSHKSGQSMPHEEPPPPYSGPQHYPPSHHPQQQPPHNYQHPQHNYQPQQHNYQHPPNYHQVAQPQTYQQHPQPPQGFQPQQNHPQQNYQPQLQYNDTYRNKQEVSENIRPPVSAYRNETQAAPIVRTKPIATYGGHNNNNYPCTQKHNLSMQHSPSQRVQHMRDDSGLGGEHPDMSRAPSSSHSMTSGSTHTKSRHDAPHIQNQTPNHYQHQTQPVYSEQVSFEPPNIRQMKNSPGKIMHHSPSYAPHSKSPYSPAASNSPVRQDNRNQNLMTEL